MVAAGGLRYRAPLGRGRPAMDEGRTLAVDIGGTGIKLAVLDGSGKIIGKRVRLPTPSPPVGPEAVTAAIGIASARLGAFDRAAVGFPGVVRGGRIVTAPNLGTELWAGFDLQATLAERFGKPVRVMNDADVQGFGAISGEGVEMMLTLGTGAGTAIFHVGRLALEKAGKKKWNKRVARIIDILRRVVNFDHLYIGGGNAKLISFALPPDVSIVPN